MADMEWKHNRQTGEYTLSRGACRTIVWDTAVDGWAVSITGPDSIEGQPHFATRDEAQAWAVARLAELQAEGKC